MQGALHTPSTPHSARRPFQGQTPRAQGMRGWHRWSARAAPSPGTSTRARRHATDPGRRLVPPAWRSRSKTACVPNRNRPIQLLAASARGLYGPASARRRPARAAPTLSSVRRPAVGRRANHRASSSFVGAADNRPANRAAVPAPAGRLTATDLHGVPVRSDCRAPLLGGRSLGRLLRCCWD